MNSVQVETKNVKRLYAIRSYSISSSISINTKVKRTRIKEYKGVKSD